MAPAAPQRARSPMAWMSSARMMSLCFLVAQNTSLVLVMRYVRARQDREMFLASTAVTCDELLKFTICSVLVLREVIARASMEGVDEETGQFNKKAESLWTRLCSTVLTSEGVQMAIPALLYTLQKNLLYVALSNLDACVYQVAYQGKVLTTALFSYLMLQTALTRRKLAALFLLMIGVALVEVAKLSKESHGPAGEHPGRGFLAVMMACCTSGFASVFFEYKLKQRSDVKPVSVWVRNLQLSFFAGILAATTVFTKDWSAIRKGGFFQGYDFLVCCTITLEAAGGLLVGLVIKYADNIAKIFAMALSLTLVTALSALIWEFEITITFVLGAFLTVLSTYMYSSVPSSPKAPPRAKQARV